MKITPLSAHAWQLTRFGFVNCYLVRETDGFTLIDTGLAGTADAILDAARQCGSQICRIVLTHAHTDHIGSLDKLAHMLGTVDVAISARDARLMRKPPAQDLSLDPGEPQCKIKGGLPGALTAPTHLLGDGELFGSLRCFATPGHTPGHFSFLDERDGTLYAGDALMTPGGKPHISGFGPGLFNLFKLVTWHRPTARGSIQRLCDLVPAETPIRRIAAGHGRVVEGGKEQLDVALQEAAD